MRDTMRPHWSSILIARALQGVLTGACVGCVIGFLRISLAMAGDHVQGWLADWSVFWWKLPLWGLVLLGAGVFLRFLVRDSPLINGSGIPQTELALAGRLPFCWWRVLLAKFAGSWVALFAGLALGREGPSIQMGGAVGAGFHALWSAEGKLSQSPHVVAGAAAGLAAAFGAPVAGFLFAFEEMKCRMTPPLLVGTAAAVWGAHVVLGRVFGLGLIFPFGVVTPPPPEAWWFVCVQGILVGLAGVLYNTTLIWLHDREARQHLLPGWARALPPLLLAGCLAIWLPAMLGGGETLIMEAGRQQLPLLVVCGLLPLRYIFSQYSTVAAIPGGLLMPILCLGALTGSLLAEVSAAVLPLWGGAFAPLPAYVLLGMAAMFSATVRAPLTGLFLVLEMTGAYACLPWAALAAFLAYLVANGLHCPPVYVSLKQREIQSLSLPSR